MKKTTVWLIGLSGVIPLLLFALSLPADSAIMPPTQAFSKIKLGNQVFDAITYNSEMDFAKAKLPYAQLSSNETQPVLPLGAASNITFNANDGIYGITHSIITNNHEIIIQEDGIYFIMAGAQIGRSNIIPAGVHNLWIAKNNINMPNTNIKTTIPAITPNTIVGVVNWVGYLDAGDIITIMQSCPETTEVQIEATAAGTPPATPSIILTMFKRIGT